MKLSEKIQYLRRKKGYSQEELAEICGVSRQSVSKWESGTALPEIEKLIRLGDLFHVHLDFLLREEYEGNAVKESYTCGMNMLQSREEQFFEGILIKESIRDDRVIDLLSVNKIELWKTAGVPKYWTALFFTSERPDLPEQLAKALIGGPEENWFVDFKAKNTKYIVFHNKIFHYTIGNRQEKDAVCEQCRKLGIGEEEMNWTE